MFLLVYPRVALTNCDTNLGREKKGQKGLLPSIYEVVHLCMRKLESRALFCDSLLPGGPMQRT